MRTAVRRLFESGALAGARVFEVGAATTGLVAAEGDAAATAGLVPAEGDAAAAGRTAGDAVGSDEVDSQPSPNVKTIGSANSASLAKQ